VDKASTCLDCSSCSDLGISSSASTGKYVQYKAPMQDYSLSHLVIIL
jgi:hypothetical protein